MLTDREKKIAGMAWMAGASGSTLVAMQKQLEESEFNQEPTFTHQFYGICKHGGPGVGFPCEECRNG